MTPEAERFNGWAAMLGFVAAVGAYVTTGQIIPGWFQVLTTKITEKCKNFLVNSRKDKQKLAIINFVATIINYCFFQVPPYVH